MLKSRSAYSTRRASSTAGSPRSLSALTNSSSVKRLAMHLLDNYEIDFVRM